ncbi:MAG: polysaccharide biosynthesis tyrosine autokinase [Planctomycetaceae bacterium]|nr:polysaccharide biosynthesis tyrosine autokinase [Planctomycetaceae bacterium]
MDGIQPSVTGPPRPPGLQAHTPTFTPLHGPTPSKSPSDYLRALRRRIWLVLVIAVPLGVLGAVWTVRQPSVYRAVAQVVIEPPQFDPVLSTLVSNNGVPRDAEASEKYIPNRIAMLKSKVMADQVFINDPSLIPTGLSAQEASEELLANLQARLIQGTNQVTVSLEGTDPARTVKQLSLLLELMKKQARDEVVQKNYDSRDGAQASLKQLEGESRVLNEKIYEMLRKHADTIGPEGKNIKQAQFEMLGSLLMQKHARLGELQQQAWLAQSFPNLKGQAESSSREGQIAELERVREELTGRMRQFRRTIRYFDSDPSVKYTAEKLDRVMDRLTRLRSAPTATSDGGTDPYEALVENMRTEIRSDEENVKKALAEMQESMPTHQRFIDLLNEQKQKVVRIGELQRRIADFNIVAQSQKDPIALPPSIPEPTVPVRPRRALNIVLGTVSSFALGIGLVCLMEHLDHSVKVPEHLAAGLTLPLFGVVPRIRRAASIQRAGHLWTPGAPGSIEADAFRNLRASLLGVSDKHGPIVTLLVTSAKAGEGKSTTALNLAATCARAGERTLLMDVDLRWPSLGGVFRHEGGHDLGLVDVLRGDLPWQRTVVRTDIPNLDFLPTGDVRNVPIEILGTLELRQLILALSNHYDRVILDGPAILGLADCRMLGRIVDAALLVVRSGSQELRPLQRAKAMLEQSHVMIAGVVFNGLHEDLKNWSSYGPDAPYGPAEGVDQGRRLAAGGLDAPSDEHAALPLAGSFRD